LSIKSIDSISSIDRSLKFPQSLTDSHNSCHFTGVMSTSQQHDRPSNPDCPPFPHLHVCPALLPHNRKTVSILVMDSECRSDQLPKRAVQMWAESPAVSVWLWCRRTADDVVNGGAESSSWRRHQSAGNGRPVRGESKGMRTQSGTTDSLMWSEAPQFTERSTIGFEGTGVFVTEQSESEARFAVYERNSRTIIF
jgi:hypothetical protein